MADIEQMTDEERVRWVLNTPRSERPERGPLPKLGFWKLMALSIRLPDPLRKEVVDGFLTQDEALEAEVERIGRMPSEERVGYVLSTPSYERPKKGPLEGETISSFSETGNELGWELSDDIKNGYLTLEEAKPIAEERNEAKRAAKARKKEKRAAEAERRGKERATEAERRAEERAEREEKERAEREAEVGHIGRMSSEERVEYVLSTPADQRPKKGPLEGRSVLGYIMHDAPDDLASEVWNGYLTLDEAKAVGMRRKERETELDPTILHVISAGYELKVYPGYLEWGRRWMKMGKFETMPFSRILKIETRRTEYTVSSRDLCIVATDESEVKFHLVGKEHAELITRTIYRAMGGDHTKVGKINLIDG